MPFDGKEIEFKPDSELTPRERGLQLARELRNLPASHEWDYTWPGGPRDALVPSCGSVGCAIGYARWRWPTVEDGNEDGFLRWYRFFGLSNKQGDDIFINAERQHGCLFDQVTPAMVAEALEAALAEG